MLAVGRKKMKVRCEICPRGRTDKNTFASRLNRHIVGVGLVGCALETMNYLNKYSISQLNSFVFTPLLWTVLQTAVKYHHMFGMVSTRQ